MPRPLLAAALVLASSLGAGAVMLPGGGPKKSDCRLELMSNGIGFPSGGRYRGTTCADGDVCDADGERNGRCLFTPMVCVNVADPTLPKCSIARIESVRWKGKKGVDASGLDAATKGLGLPVDVAACSVPVDLVIPVGGADKTGTLVKGTGRVDARAKTTRGTDKDRYDFVCLPATGPQLITISTTTTSTTSTSLEPGATTSTTTPGPGVPGAGLHAVIVGATISPAGQVAVTFNLTDANGIALIPKTSSTSNPNEARVRMTIARIEVDAQTVEGFTTTFTKYVNYITGSPAGGNQPTYDTTGTFTLVSGATGTWTYTFGRTLPPGFPTNLTHTVGAQIGREFEGEDLVANPVFNFVPDGSQVTTVREDVTTAQCNQCHNPLALHGGGRREVHLCQLCHTDQAIDPDTGNTIDFKQMVHRIHRGKELPSVEDGPVGTKYEIIGFGGSEHVFGEKVKACVNGPFPSAPCESDADCGMGGTCTGTATVGVGFPQDLRNCAKCHPEGAGGPATAEYHRTLPSVLACTGCHDDVNPGSAEEGFDGFNGLAAGENHEAGQQPEAFCRLCHKADADQEFDITIPGAHVVPARSTQLAGLQAEIVSATGTASNPVQVQFRLRNGAGTPLLSFTGFTISFAISGPTADYGGASTPLIRATALGNGASGTLVPPDGSGLAMYTTAASLPADAAGTWTVGLETRHSVAVKGLTCTTSDECHTGQTCVSGMCSQNVNEAAQNPVLNFSVDGSPVVARRQVVAQANCGNCHGTFSKDFGIHGNLRNRVEYCVLCHNPKVTDFARRTGQVANGADPMNQAIHFKRLIHKIHRGEELEQQPFIVYGFGGGVNLGEVRFPGDLRDCDTCHTGGSQLLPLPAGVLPTVQSVVNMGVEEVVGTTPPIQTACLACHDSDAAAAHAETNTTASGAEACTVCHGEGAVVAVSEVHATP